MKGVPREQIKLKRRNGWFKWGVRQFNLALKYGLTEDTKYLDIGCGDLRGGIHVISNIRSGNYYGINPIIRSPWGDSEKFDTYEDLMGMMGIVDKKINIGINEVFDFEPIKYDMIMAWSLFTHLTDEQIKLCIKNTSKVMHDKTIWLATIRKAKRGVSKIRGNNYRYPISFFKKVARENGLSVKTEDDIVKVNQSLIVLRRK